MSQLQLAKEERVGFKSPITMAGIGSLVLVFFGILGREGETVFEISRRVDVIQLPAITVGSSALGWVAGILMLAIAGYSLSFALKNRTTPLWVSVIYGAIGVVSLLGWLASGNSVPVTFIVGTALVLAVPIMLGAMGGLMCERVGVTNIAIEAQLLTGAFLAAVVSSITDNFFFGLASAMIGGALVSMVLAVFAIKYLAQQIIVGVVLNVLMIGITNFLYQ
ncbi:MAG: ABC transporter permease subunit, partial [Aquiluna sp.]